MPATIQNNMSNNLSNIIMCVHKNFKRQILKILLLFKLITAKFLLTNALEF